MKTVIVIVSGGVVQDVVCPAGVQAIVRDYDVDGSDEGNLAKDKDGQPCAESVWCSDEQTALG